MIIRPARAIDAPALIAMLDECREKSRYAAMGSIDRDVARKFFCYGVQRHGGTTDGSTFLMVAENGEGVIEAFVYGVLSRIYAVGTRLGANDQFLIARRKARADVKLRAMNALIDAYLDWADGNPKVCEVALSHSDTVPGSEALTEVFKRRGFVPYHQAWRRETPHARLVSREAA